MLRNHLIAGGATGAVVGGLGTLAGAGTPLIAAATAVAVGAGSEIAARWGI